MGRRFGRNQKRAMRNKIQAQELLLEKHIDIIAEKNTELRQANEIIKDTAILLGEHFATLPVQTAEVKEIRERYEYSTQRTPNYWNACNTPITAFVQHALCYIDTHQADAKIDELSGAIHMRYKSISGKVSYGVSMEAWRRLPEEILVKKFAEQIAQDMAIHLVRERKKALSDTYHLSRSSQRHFI